MKLNRLNKNGKIGIIAPAFPPNAEKLRKGIDYLLGLGFELDLGDSLTARQGYFSGSDSLRIDELHRMYADPSIDMIICARGGWGGLRLLDQIDYDLVKQNPKALVGYSDVTTLQLAFWHMSGVPSLSGPMVAVEMGSGILPFTAQNFWDQVNNTQSDFTYSFKEENIEVWQQGQAEGSLLGGCLSMVAHQLGTPYSPDYTGSILFIEDVGEQPYKIDRYLAQLRQAGVFDNINGLILGDFLDCEDEDADRGVVSLKELLQEYFADANFPVIYNFPYGHGMKKVTMPIGVQTKLDTNLSTLSLGNPFL